MRNRKNKTEISKLSDIKEILIWGTSEPSSDPILVLGGNTLVSIASRVRRTPETHIIGLDGTKKKEFIIDKLDITFSILEISDKEMFMYILNLLDPENDFSIFKVEFVYKNAISEVYTLPLELVNSNWKDFTDIAVGFDDNENNFNGNVRLLVDTETGKRGL